MFILKRVFLIMRMTVNRYLIFILVVVFSSGCVADVTNNVRKEHPSLSNPADSHSGSSRLGPEYRQPRQGPSNIENGLPGLFDYANKESINDTLIDNYKGLCCEAGKTDVNIDNPDKEQNFLDTALEFYETSQEFWKEDNPDKAMAALDQAYANMLKVKADDTPKLVQQVDDLRFMISKRVLEIYASRYTAVKGNHKAIPLVMNRYVENEIKLFQGPERKFFIDSYRRSGRYRGEIVKMLREAGLPEELSWLPLIESGFKIRALSRARALGLWQFIPSTGYKFGLSRNAWIDERLDPRKSAKAAIAYLKELHNIFGDWTTVLASYNCGEGTVLRVIRHQKVNYLDNFWDLFQKLPFETARYVPRFLAVLQIVKDPVKYGFNLDAPYPVVPYEVATIDRQVHLKKVAGKLGISAKELTDLNPELRYKATPPNPYILKVPVGKASLLLATIDDIPKWTPPQRAYAFHRVRSGETLSLIALKYRSSVRAIMRANRLRSKHFIRIGRKLKIPLRREGVRTHRASKGRLRADGTYRVKRGDSLWRIAHRFSTSAAAIKRLNKMNSTFLYVGQILKIRNL
ncbi:membrane-bound lytic murein transglycosylase D precursor [bacterium BMS3Bbin06]|nr:membrane-bound lytic murein transglycosylase D precursor [bacterium BMS3Bbin06]